MRVLPASLERLIVDNVPAPGAVSHVFAWVFLLTVVTIGLWDIFVTLEGGGAPSVSDQIRQAVRDAPVLAFAAGLLCGHLFWSRYP